jgi:hypothetical protein
MGVAAESPWKRLLAEPGESCRIVQLYQDDEFYTEAIAYFAAEGLARGESIIVAATEGHWRLVADRLRKTGCELVELLRSGQLTHLDANATLLEFMHAGMPDRVLFKAIAKDAIVRARCGGRFPRVRWCGEMVDILYASGNLRGFEQLAQFLGEVAREENTAVFCSLRMDKYDPKIYDGSFAEICRRYTHVIPAANYANHRDAVDQAVSDVIGDIRGPLLKSLIDSHEGPAMMPSSQGLLLWVKDNIPQSFAAVLARAREIELGGEAPQAL